MVRLMPKFHCGKWYTFSFDFSPSPSRPAPSLFRDAAKKTFVAATTFWGVVAAHEKSLQASSKQRSFVLLSRLFCGLLFWLFLKLIRLLLKEAIPRKVCDRRDCHSVVVAVVVVGETLAAERRRRPQHPVQIIIIIQRKAKPRKRKFPQRRPRLN